jgi:hypothetical protein
MNGTLIATTPRGNMHPLAYQGILATDCHHQIVSILRNRLGDSHVLLFAEPAFDPGRDIIDWYSPVQGTPVKMVDLPVDRQDAVRATLIKMASDILTQAQQLKNTGDNNRILSGSIIELALQYPGDECIYLVGEQPVLICWGFGPATAGASPQDLSRLSSLSPRQAPAQAAVSEPSPPQPPAGAAMPGPEPGPVAEAPRPPRRFPWWLLWLLVLAGVLLLLWLLYGKEIRHRLFPEKGVPADTTATVPAPETPDELKAAMDQNRKLRRERDELLTILAVKAAQCQQPAPRDEHPGTPLQVPENAAKDGGLGFLQGVWRCDSDLSTPKDPVVVEYIFDEGGKGQITVKTSQKICSAGVTASLDPSGDLRIESDDTIPCSTGKAIDGQRVTCVGKGAETSCQGLNITSKTSWKARFLKF